MAITSMNKRPKVLIVDRLSSLPDAVICHILSFLPTNISLSTSILAKRWRFLWAHVPTLDLSRSEFPGANFSSIIHRVMLRHRVQTIHTFRLRYDRSNCSAHDLETWITTAILRSVKNLVLLIHPKLLLPPCIFTCKTLVDLTLNRCTYTPSSGVCVSLPLLKRLKLYFVFYVVQEALTHLLYGCPVLEELTIDGVRDRHFECFEIASPTIQRLLLGHLPIHIPMVDVNAPALRYFRVVHGSWHEHITISPGTSLVDVDINVDDFLGLKAFDQFLNNLRNVQRLKLSTDGYNRKLTGAPGPFGWFDNLTRLELDADYFFLLRFFESAGNIEVLILHQFHTNLKRLTKARVETLPKRIVAHLRIVKIDGFGCTEKEFSMLRYLLRNAHVLERMGIDSKDDGSSFKETFDALKRISSFERGSKLCVVVFNEVCLGVDSSGFCFCHLSPSPSK